MVLTRQPLGNVFRREPPRQPRDAFANHKPAHRAGRIFRILLRGGERLEARVVPLSLPLFRDDQDLHVKSPALQTSVSPPIYSPLLSACRSGIPFSSFSSAHKFFPPAA